MNSTKESRRTGLFGIVGSAIAVTAFALAGCTSQPADPAGGTTTADEKPAGDESHDHEGHGHDHAHPTEGPHGGSLIELGEEEYHAELVHDASTVTVYVLDAAAKEVVPIEAADVTINLKHDGKPEQFKLAAAPQEKDGGGKSSRFTVESADLVAHLDAEDAGPRLLVVIGGKSFNGVIEHHHDHDGHDHEGHSHDH